ncbi:Tetratricopeptide repeat protein 12 [Habropoda laboriosa]|uniref:Tetratricopeptide repeat protein 12 n=1 Tax=Habropoda laboriosa TaxID=597456 RepID=A0A0L7RD02_9HYME|nr:PREDICTED: tetratricopeptide repeat protein 12-like [Habropoda laboriosa]KOC68641.1 Tetratricopeptide repeat protein 12 [Habropoda laboriosa]
MNTTLESDKLGEKITEAEQMMDNLTVDKKVTEEEFQNFMQRVTQVEKIVKKLASSNPKEQKIGEILADEMLENRSERNISENVELKVKTNRTMINTRSTTETSTPEQMSQEAFMRSVEKDAKERAEDRKVRNERAEMLKAIGNGAFKEGNYEKAVTYFSKALEQRKDSTVLWNNRALSYIQLGLFEKALADCEWALKVNNANLKALLNSAKCYKQLGDEIKYKEYIELAKERNPHFNKFINEFEESMDMRVNFQA